MNFNIEEISSQMPDFENHEQARAWFKEQFHERFALLSNKEEDGERVYLYHLIKDPETYHHYMESFAKSVKHETTNMETFESYSTIEITESGDISFSI